MRRLVDRWWAVGIVLSSMVLVLAHAFYLNDNERSREAQRAAQRQVVTVLDDAVHDVLARELALARVIRDVGAPRNGRWPALANIVTSQPSATGAGFIVAVKGEDVARFERRTGLRLTQSTTTGAIRPTAPAPLHLVVVDAWSKAGPPLLGLDLASNPLRRNLLLATARSRAQEATPPVRFLGRASRHHGVVVYEPVFRHGRLIGWVSASYDAEQLAATIKARLPDARVTIRDGSTTLLAQSGSVVERPGTVRVAGRNWRVWAVATQTGGTAVPWLLLGFGLALTAAISLVLRQAATREQYAQRRLAQHDAEEASLAGIATLVAQGAPPEAVFASVAEQVGQLLGARTAAVSRFDPEHNLGRIVGDWTPDGHQLTGAVFTLDGVTASAEVFRTGRPARTSSGYESPTDPISQLMNTLGSGGGIAAPITVGGQAWGALGAAYGHESIPAAAEDRLQRFGLLLGLAIANADAWEKLDRHASTDPLTGLANRRVFDDRLGAEIARAHRYSGALSLAVFDLDHFKRINDTQGHQAGDDTLVRFAELLTAHARQSDVIARVGGEEFAWVMPETDAAGSYVAAERVRAAMAETRGPGREGVTVSVGVVSASELSTAETLFAEADRALYLAKESGRNQTAVYGEPVAAP